MLNAMRLLERFAKTAHKVTLEPEDLIRFCELCMYIHEHALNLTGPQIRAYLSESGFSTDVAFRLGVQYERYGDLLRRRKKAAEPSPARAGFK